MVATKLCNLTFQLAKRKRASNQTRHRSRTTTDSRDHHDRNIRP